MNDKPPKKLGLSHFLRDLRRADPLLWIAAALVAAIFILRWLFS